MKINDTVNFKEGQIFSDTPQLKINAPNEVKVLKVLVKEGQEVQKNDTLFILENKKTKSDYDILNTDVASMENKIAIIKNLIFNTLERKNSLIQLLTIQSNIYKSDRNKTAQEINSLNNKIKLSSQQTSILTDKFKTDSLLYAKGAISRYEMTDTKNRNLDDKKGQVDIKSSFSVKNYDFENLLHNYERTKNDLKRNIIDVDNQIQNYQRDIVELKAQIKDAKSNLTYISDELGKLVIVSPINGTISNLFNARQNIEIVSKNDLLTIIAPKKETFYAKVILDEKDLAYIKKGQDINLKLDAYNYYRYGAIKGNITYVSPSDVDKTFYCLANIKKYNPNINLKAGYKLKGEVIIEEMKLFQYIIKKLFNKIDSSIH
ncbi:HlyD family efflux transporter periplasmic adaptor subunit [Flavobacterium psychrotolerans]|uniref:HlyD family efflux transporter periplasmic adaptor subunit n=1 Tax=Flavobacterium psychrotolerans TaxID=2169410 RepID=UPI00140CCFF4|nr:HlyD family efflux transporter periplasmic adaptor subunit [Flavobacterium psychrotolerans]